MVYPDDPAGLPESVFNNAYDSDDPPVSAPSTRYETILPYTRIRDDKRQSSPLCQDNGQNVVKGLLALLTGGMQSHNPLDPAKLSFCHGTPNNRNGSSGDADSPDSDSHGAAAATQAMMGFNPRIAGGGRP